MTTKCNTESLISSCNAKKSQMTLLWKSNFKMCWVLNNYIIPMLVTWGFPCSSVGKEYACNAGYLGSLPGWGRPPREGNGYPLQYSCLENPMDREAWRTTVHGVTRVGYDLAIKPPPPPPPPLVTWVWKLSYGQVGWRHCSWEMDADVVKLTK